MAARSADLHDPTDPQAEGNPNNWVVGGTSIENQFEFVTQKWVNNPNFKEAGVGFDLVIGQNANAADNRVRTAKLILDDPNHPETLTAPKDWVIPTGGGYFFAPSIDVLDKHLSR